MSKTTEFLTELFEHTWPQRGGIWLQALGDKPGQLATRWAATHFEDAADGFVADYDVAGNGVYLCVSTTINGAKRNKENVAEIIGLWVDVDLKDVIDSADDVTRKILAARKPPSFLNNSGNGRHGWWLFKEPLEGTPDNQARVELALKQLADLFGGDHAVTHCAALMRLPGSHNTKRGEWKEVEIIASNGARYELDDLEEWLSETSPVILRKSRPADFQEINPFLAIAATLGFKPPIDVESRLRAMSYMGGGEAAVHATQLAVSASMLRQGANVETVVGTILDATRAAAGGYGANWNWRREENAIRKMCTDWLRKHPAENVVRMEPARGAVQGREINETIGAGGEVIAIAPKRAQKAATQGGSGASHHVLLGEAVLGVIRGHGRDLLVTAGEVWHYADGLWSKPDNETHWLNVQLETGVRALEFPSSIKLINEARQWLLRHPDLARAKVNWDSHGKIATKSGLLDVTTMTLEAARPEHYATWRIECAFDPDAKCPWWEQMLADVFADRPADLRDATIATVQEVLGAALLEDKSRELTRALVLEGPSEAGKTRVLDVMAGLFGDNPIATPLDTLGSAHGLMEFRRRAPWVLHEAFNASVWHLSSVVKSILTGDPVQINIKNGALISQRIKAPVFWGTNHPPQFKEATKAIVNRMIVIKCRVVFDPKRLIGAAAEAASRGLSGPSALVLKHEMPGLLNWALTGLRRALARGSIALTAEMDATLEAVRQDSNIVAGFLAECCEFDGDGMVSVPDLCAAFAVWWIDVKGDDRRIPSNESVGRAMTALGDKRIACDASLRDKDRRYYGGLQLNAIGLDYWQGAASEGMAKGKTARTSAGRNDVNRIIPTGWHNRPAVMTVRGDRSSVARAGDDRSPKF